MTNCLSNRKPSLPAAEYHSNPQFLLHSLYGFTHSDICIDIPSVKRVG